MERVGPAVRRLDERLQHGERGELLADLSLDAASCGPGAVRMRPRPGTVPILRSKMGPSPSPLPPVRNSRVRRRFVIPVDEADAP